jgi:catechol 2,3-dioxygenase-like lactoylglutathione lyase family enzyme
MKDGWYSRPVLFVDSVERAIAFYCDKLGFVEGQRYEEDGTLLLGEVFRGDCTLLLNCQQPEKTGRSRIFISLAPGLIDDLRVELETRGAPIRDGWWGYDTMIINDPDGNELFFPYPV